MAFLETPRFPDGIAAWLIGGRGFMTTIVETFGGNEYRNSAWDQARGEWNIDEAMRVIQDTSPHAMKLLSNMFFVARGAFHGFRLKAPLDNTDDGGGVLGVTGLGVAATTVYQMYKNYFISPLAYQQLVGKPVGLTIKVYVDSVLKTLGTDYAIDQTTGLITFASQPTIGATLTWTGSYDIPVRFGGDMPAIGRDPTGALLSWQGLKLIEIRNP